MTMKGFKVESRYEAGQGGATMRGYTPSVLVTTGRLALRSLGEDMLEVWGEVRDACVAAAMGGDVAVVFQGDRLRFGPKTFTVHTRGLFFQAQRTRKR